MYKHVLLVVFLSTSAGLLHAEYPNPNKENCQVGDRIIVNYAFLEAAKNGDLDCVDRFTEPQFDVNMTARKGEYEGKTALMVAAMYGKIEVVKFLYRKNKGLDIDKVDDEGKTALILAIEEGHEEVATFLAPLSENLNRKYGPEEITVLHYSISSGRTEFASELIGIQSVDVNMKNKNGDTPLMWAAARGQDKVVAQLLSSRNIKTEAKNNKGLRARDLISSYNVESMRNRQAVLDVFNRYDSAVKKLSIEAKLITEAKRGNLSEVQKIVATKAKEIDLNKKESLEGSTALISAIAWEHTDTAVWLLSQPGVDVNIADKRGNTPLIHAVITENEELVSEIAVRQDTKIYHKNQEGLAAIDIAKRKNNSVIVRTINLEVDKDTNELFESVLGGDLPKLATVLESGVDINTKKSDKNGETVLIAASYKTNLSSAVFNTLLSKRGIDVNKQSDSGVTALMAAAKNGNETAAKFLLRADGIDLNLKDSQGKTALDIARDESVTGIVALLEARSKPKGFSLRGIKSFFKSLFN